MKIHEESPKTVMPCKFIIIASTACNGICKLDNTLRRDAGGSTTSVTAGERVMAARVSRQQRQLSDSSRSALLALLYSRSTLLALCRKTGSAICDTCMDRPHIPSGVQTNIDISKYTQFLVTKQQA